MGLWRPKTRPRPRFERGPGRQLLLLFSGLALCYSCAVSPAQPQAESEQSQQQTSPNQSILLALQDALQDGENEAAQLILERLAERELDQREAELVAGFRKVLVGRGLVRGLRMELMLHEQEGKRQLQLALATQGQEDLTLLFPPITLEYVHLSISPQGEISRNLTSQLLHPLGQFEIKPGEPAEIVLGECPTQFPSGALAVRDAWRLTLRAGQIRTATDTYPAERFARPQLTVDTRAPDQDTAPEEPEVFVKYLASVLRDEGGQEAELLSRAVRLDPERRKELLPLLAEVLEPYSNPLMDKSGSLAEAVVPSLRWISPGVKLDSSLSAWSEWTHDWLQRSTQMERAKNRSGLILP